VIDETGNLLRPLLSRQLAWVIGLRWFAAGAIIAFDFVQWGLGPYFRPPGVMALIGLGLLVVNGALRLLSRGAGTPSAARLGVLAWAQLAADLAALTAIVLLTGGLASPVIGFAIFPMIFASLFLSRVQAYAAALLAVALLTVALELVDRWPHTGLERMTAIGWILTLFFSVHLVNRATRGLFRREQARLIQERSLLELKERLIEQERAMAGVEKLVSIGQLAAGVAHEISNPLASIDGLLQLMQRSPEKPRPEAVRQMREQVARISATVRQMTMLGHPDLGEPEMVDLNALVRETAEILGYDRRLRAIAVDLDLAPDLAPVRVNPRAVRQALMNLLINAADALVEASAPRIRLSSARENGTIRLVVADNGPGVPESERERIFEPFVTTKPVGRGTGLGLPISRDLIQGQGGRLSLEPGDGSGASFLIELPDRV
jgi:signal transduction histidine kinase